MGIEDFLDASQASPEAVERLHQRNVVLYEGNKGSLEDAFGYDRETTQNVFRGISEVLNHYNQEIASGVSLEETQQYLDQARKLLNRFNYEEDRKIRELEGAASVKIYSPVTEMGENVRQMYKSILKQADRTVGIENLDDLDKGKLNQPLTRL